MLPHCCCTHQPLWNPLRHLTIPERRRVFFCVKGFQARLQSNTARRPDCHLCACDVRLTQSTFIHMALTLAWFYSMGFSWRQHFSTVEIINECADEIRHVSEIILDCVESGRRSWSATAALTSHSKLNNWMNIQNLDPNFKKGHKGIKQQAC